MVYTANIPNSTDNPSDSQPLFLANFQAIDTVNSVNHVAFNDADQGKHKFMQMPEQGSAPTTAANEGALYTKESSSITELFFRRESDGTEVQLTGGVATSGGQSSLTLPGGIVIKYGSLALSGTSNAVSFNAAFGTSVSMCVASTTAVLGSAVAASVGSLTTAGFTLFHNVGATTGYWVAIGI